MNERKLVDKKVKQMERRSTNNGAKRTSRTPTCTDEPNMGVNTIVNNNSSQFYAEECHQKIYGTQVFELGITNPT